MHGAPGLTTAPGRVLFVLLGLVLVTGVLVSSLLIWQSRRAGFAEAEQVTRAVAETIALSDTVITELGGEEPDGARLQRFVEAELAHTGLSYVTIMSPSGTRYTHRDPALIGGTYVGTIPDSRAPFTERHDGSMGPSVRTIVPLERGSRLLGWVSVGVTVASVAESVRGELPLTLGITAGVIAVGSLGALLGRRITRAVTGDRSVASVREQLSAHDSLRTMGQALRAQTHEHGNQLHTAVALIELGRPAEAVALLTESSQQSQQLVDEVAVLGEGDPVLGALLLGKTAEARERCVELRVAAQPCETRPALTETELVSVVGNLVDNAIDAAAAGPDPRWVELSLAVAGLGSLRLDVANSGGGVPAELRDRLYEPGITTKEIAVVGLAPEPLDRAHGFGLPLVRGIVEQRGGTISFSDNPTTFSVNLPAELRQPGTGFASATEASATEPIETR